MESIFTVQNEHLQHLDSKSAVDFFRELLWAEATATGIGKNLINVPSAITVADGGIDAEVEHAEPHCGQGLIKEGLTRYQIKTGGFSLQGDVDIRAILFRGTTHELKPRIKSCLDANGTLVAVLFGSDNPETKDNQTKQRFIGILRSIDEKYVDAKIEIWRQNHLIGFLSRFPSLALKVTGRYKTRFQSHRSWSLQDDMFKDFKEGESQHELVERLRTDIRNAVSAVHIRIWGEAGIGKTRLALEATHTADLAPLVVYCDSAANFRDSTLMNELLKDDNTFSAILVVDECDPDARSYIWNKFKHRGNRIRLVSLYGEYDVTSGDIVYLEAPPLEKGQIVSILQSYDLPKDQADRWTDICSGSPRVAHVIGLNLKSNPENLLKPSDTVNIWARYVQAGDDPDSESVIQRTLVLRYIALFKRFGFGKPLVDEAQVVAKLIQESDPSITWSRFQEIVQHLRRRSILQGDTTLYITPKALHLWLWVDWWETYGGSFDYEEFCKKLPPQLLEWFMEMFRYAWGYQAASTVVADLLGPNGPFRDSDFFQTQRGADFFLSLSEADPKAALTYLKRTIGTWDKNKLLEFKNGRRQVVWALKNIAVWRELFAGAAVMLLALGEAENELRISNNASGEFTSLFAVGTGPVASTEASPWERWPVLEEALQSPSGIKRRLAINACDVALQSGYWSRLAGSENQGLRQGASLWVPKTYGDIWEWYRRVWESLINLMDQFDDEDRAHTLEVILRRTRGLNAHTNLSDVIMQGIRSLVSKPYLDNKTILAQVIKLLHYDGKNLPEQNRKAWELIRDDLTGDNYSSLLKRYVGLDLLEDRFDEQGNRIDQIQPRLEELAQQSNDDTGLLTKELNWLVTIEAQNGFKFGYELGIRDKRVILLPQILESQRAAGADGTLYFLGGYLRGYREIDSEGWEWQIDGLEGSEQTKKWIPELTQRSGPLSDRAANRILDLLQSGATSIDQMRLFVFGGVIDGLSQEIFEQWIKHLLLGSNDYAVAIAIDLFTMYNWRQTARNPLPKDLTLKLLLHDSLFQPGQLGKFYNEVYNWSVVGKWFLRDHPKDSLGIAEKTLQYLGEEGTIVEGFHSEARTLLNDIAQQFPNEVWAMVSNSLGPPIDALAYHVKEWLRGDDLFKPGDNAMIEVFPSDKIWEWIRENPDERAWYAATFIPPTLFRRADQTCLARELLIRFGDREAVRRNLQANFSSEGWSGPTSVHLQTKKTNLLDFRGSESDSNVIRWIDEYVEYLDAQISQARMEEERRHP